MRINDFRPEYAPSATVSIREWSAAYYASAAAGKGRSITTAATPFTISGVGAGGAGAKDSAPAKSIT